MASGTILYKLSLDATQFEKGLKTAERTLKKVGGNIASFGKTLSTYVTAPLMGAAAVAVKSWDVQAKAIAQVAQGLKSTGNTVGFTSAQLQKMASDLQKTTLFGDEKILQEATAQLLTFTNIAGEQFQRAQKAALDLSTRLDGDLKSAAIMVGKALNDPVSALSAMSRAGVQFSESQETLIKQLASTGRIAEAQKIILSELEKQYGGSAEAAVTGAGKLVQLKNAVGDLMEQFGQIIMQYLDPLIERIRGLTERLSNMDDATRRNVVRWAAVAAAIGPVIFLIGKTIVLFGGIAKAIRIVSAALYENPIVLLITAIVVALAGLAFIIKSVVDSWDAFAGYGEVMWKRIKISFLTGKAFIVKVFEEMINMLIRPLNKLAAKLGLGELLGEVNFGLDKTADTVRKLQSEIDNSKYNNPKAVWSDFSDAAKANMDKVKGWFSFGMGKIQEKAVETGEVLSATLGGGATGTGTGTGKRKGTAVPSTMEGKGTPVIGSAIVEANDGLANMAGFIEKDNQKVQELTKSWWSYADVVGFVSNTIPTITDAFGQMITGTKGAFKDLVGSVLDGLKQIINGLLAQAIAGLIAGEAKKGIIGLIGASVGLGVLTAIWNSKVPKLAMGGVIPSGFPNDSYPALLSSGETVIPKPIGLNNAYGMPQRVELFASYDTLKTVLDFGAKRRNS
jgi:hypothetical protein